MDKILILHIPYSSTNIPLKDRYIVDDILLAKEMLKLTDWYTEDLFYSDGDELIIAPLSRIFCDPERFIDDSQEVMAQYGMGVLYEKSDDDEIMRKVTQELKEKVLNGYYWKHHNRLSDAVNSQLKRFGKALILDCHSYPSEPLKRDLDQNHERPDFNIGTNPFHTPRELIDASVSFFDMAGYTLGIDRPYKSSIVPSEHYRKNNNVQTIMLEINRALYLNEPSNEKSGSYSEIKRVTGEYIKTLKNSL